MTETQPRPIFEGSVSMANPFSERRYCSSPRPLSLTVGMSLSNASRLGEERASGLLHLTVRALANVREADNALLVHDHGRGPGAVRVSVQMTKSLFSTTAYATPSSFVAATTRL